MIEHVNFIEVDKPAFNPKMMARVLVVYCSILILIFAIQQLRIYLKEGDIADKREALAVLKQEEESLKKEAESSKQKQKAASAIEAIELELVSAKHWSRVLQALANLSPDKVWFSSFTSGGGGASAEGAGGELLVKGQSYSMGKISDLLLNLEESALFEKTTLMTTKRVKAVGDLQDQLDFLEFEINFNFSE